MPKINEVSRVFIFIFTQADEALVEEITVNGVIDGKLAKGDYVSIETIGVSPDLMIIGTP